VRCTSYHLLCSVYNVKRRSVGALPAIAIPKKVKQTRSYHAGIGGRKGLERCGFWSMKWCLSLGSCCRCCNPYLYGKEVIIISFGGPCSTWGSFHEESPRGLRCGNDMLVVVHSPIGRMGQWREGMMKNPESRHLEMKRPASQSDDDMDFGTHGRNHLWDRNPADMMPSESQGKGRLRRRSALARARFVLFPMQLRDLLSFFVYPVCVVYRRPPVAFDGGAA
jgi:hypothetical protein